MPCLAAGDNWKMVKVAAPVSENNTESETLVYAFAAFYKVKQLHLLLQGNIQTVNEAEISSCWQSTKGKKS